MGYLGLILWGQVLDGRNLTDSDWPPYARGSWGSPLMRKIDGSHHGVKVSECDRRMIMQWLNASAPYAGTYAALGCGFVGGNKSRHPYNSTWDRPPNVPAHQTVKSRCVACHTTLDADPRFDMPKFCPNPEYIREMKRYGILPKDVDPAR